MVVTVKVPGTCGELLQGSIKGQDFLVTCPINRYATARAGKTEGPLPPKARLAREKTLAYLGITKEVPVTLSTEIEPGKGMASSSADIAAVCQAVALAVGKRLTYEEIMDICLSIEPSDAVVYPGCVQFDYLHGRIRHVLGHIPDSKILMFDTGGTVDTVLFNQNKELHLLRKKNESVMIKALALLKEGIANQDLRAIGQAATWSAFANQGLLHKKDLDKVWAIGKAHQSYGLIVAHSGTVIGLLFEPTASLGAVTKEVIQNLPHLTYYDTVHIVHDGMMYKEEEGV